MMTNTAIKLMIVDDEPLIIRSLKVALPWDEYGIEVVGEARNGELALQVFKDTDPDIVLSDIRMPSVDGIQLMKSLFELKPDLIFILISDYGEFHYAQIGLREGAFDYLLKPIDHEELNASIQKAIQHIKQLRIKQYEKEEFSLSLQHLSQLARESMYTECLEKSDEADTTGNTSSWLEKSELKREYFICLVSLDDYVNFQRVWTLEEQKLWFYIINNILEEIAEREGALSVFPFYNGQWILVFSASLEEQAMPIAENILNSIKVYGKQKTSIGISHIFARAESLKPCYDSAKKALFRRFYDGGEHVYKDDGTHEISDSFYEALSKAEKQLLLDVKQLDVNKAMYSLDRWADIVKQSEIALEQAENLVFELITATNRQLELIEPFRIISKQTIVEELKHMYTIDECIDISKKLLSLSIDEASTDASSIHSLDILKESFEKVKAFIEKEYSKNITLDDVVDITNMSISRLCHTFKQQTSMTFFEYITRLRIEKACYMLEQNDVKIIQVAHLVGYEDVAYFGQLFRKVIGYTPTEYRQLKKS